MKKNCEFCHEEETVIIFKCNYQSKILDPRTGEPIVVKNTSINKCEHCDEEWFTRRQERELDQHIHRIVYYYKENEKKFLKECLPK